MHTTATVGHPWDKSYTNKFSSPDLFNYGEKRKIKPCWESGGTAELHLNKK
jgi:hypothetical protein